MRSSAWRACGPRRSSGRRLSPARPAASRTWRCDGLQRSRSPHKSTETFAFSRETTMSVRPVKRMLHTKPTLEGAGVRLQRAFGFGNTTDFDPFLLLDDFRND